MVIRWLLDGTRVTQLAADYQIGRSTCYDNLHEALDVLAAQAPGLHSALLAAKAAGYDYVIVDGTLIETDRCRTPGPTAGVDLWWSGKHEQHGGNIQVITAPDGWPLWTSPVRPGREHDTTALREHAEVLPPPADLDPRARTRARRPGLRRRVRHHNRRVQETCYAEFRITTFMPSVGLCGAGQSR
jgi:hypothetical protein